MDWLMFFAVSNHIILHLVCFSSTKTEHLLTYTIHPCLNTISKTFFIILLNKETNIAWFEAYTRFKLSCLFIWTNCHVYTLNLTLSFFLSCWIAKWLPWDNRINTTSFPLMFQVPVQQDLPSCPCPQNVTSYCVYSRVTRWNLCAPSEQFDSAVGGCDVVVVVVCTRSSCVVTSRRRHRLFTGSHFILLTAAPLINIWR